MQPSDGEFRLLPVGHGSEVGYWDSGRGETILLAHAGVFSDWFLPLSRELPRERFRVVRIRRAGYRGTPRPAGHLTLADHARHAARLLDALETGPVHWVGHSSGSLIGLELAQARPDLVASLTLLEPAPAGDLVRPEEEPLLAGTMSPIVQAFLSGDTSGAFDRFMATICGHDSESVLTARLGPGALDIARAESAFFFADELPAVREWAFGPDEAAGITAPAHVVMGADSLQPTLMEQSVQRLAAMLGNARVEMLSGCTHLMPLQQPVALSQLITKFVTGVTAAL